MAHRSNPTRPLKIGKIPKAYRPLIDEARRQGWRLERRNGGHLALHAPDVTLTPVFFSSSPTDGGRYTARKVLADLRRRGFVWGAEAPA